MKKFFKLMAVSFCIILGLCTFSAAPVQAHRTWRKYTKLPNGTYTIEYEYYGYKTWQQDDVKLQLGKYFVLDASVKKQSNGRVYTADPLKLKIDSKCKFYNIDEDNYHYNRISKKRAQQILKYTKGACFVTLEEFHVKNNKVDRVYLCW